MLFYGASPPRARDIPTVEFSRHQVQNPQTSGVQLNVVLNFMPHADKGPGLPI
jgi:hypothetical protein